VRYMGALDPSVKVQLSTLVQSASDEDAAEFLSIAESSEYAKRKRLERYAVGGAAGLVVGFVLAKALRKKR
jgi:hypothetical protein